MKPPGGPKNRAAFETPGYVFGRPRRAIPDVIAHPNLTRTSACLGTLRDPTLRSIFGTARRSQKSDCVCTLRATLFKDLVAQFLQECGEGKSQWAPVETSGAWRTEATHGNYPISGQPGNQHPRRSARRAHTTIPFATLSSLFGDRQAAKNRTV